MCILRILQLVIRQIRIAFEKDGVARKGIDFCTAFIWLNCRVHFLPFLDALDEAGEIWWNK
jgi:hypothetical protein